MPFSNPLIKNAYTSPFSGLFGNPLNLFKNPLDDINIFTLPTHSTTPSANNPITIDRLMELIESLTGTTDFSKDQSSKNNLKTTHKSKASGKFNQASKLGIPLGGGKLVTVKSQSGAKFSVSEKVASQFHGFINELESIGYKIDPKTSGGFCDRNIAGTSTKSQHAFGNAIDINWHINALNAKGNLPSNIRQIAAKYGIAWGGNMKSKDDPMHFEVNRLIT